MVAVKAVETKKPTGINSSLNFMIGRIEFSLTLVAHYNVQSWKLDQAITTNQESHKIFIVLNDIQDILACLEGQRGWINTKNIFWCRDI